MDSCHCRRRGTTTCLCLALQTELKDGNSLLSKVQYLSSTSGGSWFNAAFSYKACITICAWVGVGDS
jgi:hypothetical protein